MIIKYKVSDFAKDSDQPTKKVLELLTPLGGEAKKVSSNLEEGELNFLLEKLSRENAESDFGAYLASGKKPSAEPAKPSAEAAKPAA